MSRCVCGHPADVHTHYRPGLDCGACGRGVCPWFAELAHRDELLAELTATQRVALAESDARFYRNLAALAPFSPAYRDRIARLRAIPAQRARPTIAGELEIRRARRNAACARQRDRNKGDA